MLGRVRKNLKLQKSLNLVVGVTSFEGQMDFIFKQNNGERRSKFRFHIFLMFCILQVYIRYKVKIGESADVIEAMAGVGAQSQVVRWPILDWLLVTSLLLAPHFSKTITIGLGK